MNGRGPPTCYRCHRLGHISRDCKAKRDVEGHPLPLRPIHRHSELEESPPCDVKAIEDEFHSKVIKLGLDEEEWKNLSKEYATTAGAAIDRLVAENEKYRARVDDLESQCVRAPFKHRKISDLKSGQSLQVHLVNSAYKSRRRNGKRRKGRQMQGEGCSAAARNPHNDGSGPSGGGGDAGDPGGPARGGYNNYANRHDRGASGSGAYNIGGASRTPSAYQFLNMSSLHCAFSIGIDSCEQVHCKPHHDISSEEFNGSATMSAIPAREKKCQHRMAHTKYKRGSSSVPGTLSRAQKNKGARAHVGARAYAYGARAGARAHADDARAGARARAKARACADGVHPHAPGARGLAIGAHARTDGAHAYVGHTYATPTLLNGAVKRTSGVRDYAGDARVRTDARAGSCIDAPAHATITTPLTVFPRA